MKKLLLIATVAVAGFVATPSQATVVTVARVSGYFQTSPRGGEYNVSPVIGSGYDSSVLVNGGYQSFCLERDEFVTSGGSYNASVNSGGIAMGGGDNSNTGDQISLGTAWLYSQFTSGILAGYNYAAGVLRGASSYALQLTIWHLEDETLSAAEQAYLAANNMFLVAATSQFGANVKNDNNGLFSVGVLNLTEINPQNAPAQDLLTRLPDGGASVLLLGMAMLGLGAFRRALRFR